MMERGIWPMLRLVLLGSQRRTCRWCASLVGLCQGDRGSAEIDREDRFAVRQSTIRSFSSLVPGERFLQRFGNAEKASERPGRCGGAW